MCAETVRGTIRLSAAREKKGTVIHPNADTDGCNLTQYQSCETVTNGSNDTQCADNCLNCEDNISSCNYVQCVDNCPRCVTSYCTDTVDSTDNDNLHLKPNPGDRRDDNCLYLEPNTYGIDGTNECGNQSTWLIRDGCVYDDTDNRLGNYDCNDSILLVILFLTLWNWKVK